jgi:hypothetical protein
MIVSVESEEKFWLVETSKEIEFLPTEVGGTLGISTLTIWMDRTRLILR